MIGVSVCCGGGWSACALVPDTNMDAEKVHGDLDVAHALWGLPSSTILPLCNLCQIIGGQLTLSHSASTTSMSTCFQKRLLLVVVVVVVVVVAVCCCCLLYAAWVLAVVVCCRPS